VTSVLFGSHISVYERMGKYFMAYVSVCGLKLVKLNCFALGGVVTNFGHKVIQSSF